MAEKRFSGTAQRIVGKYVASPAALAAGEFEVLRVDTSGRLVVSSEALLAAVSIESSSAKTATFNSADFTNTRYQGIKLYLDITASSGTNPTLDIKLQGKDAVSDEYYDIAGAAFAQKTATGRATLTMYPSIAETNNVSVSDVLPMTYRLVHTIGGSSPSFTYSIGGELLP